MFKRFSVLAIVFFLFQPVGHTQNKGLLPFTGIVYFNEGVSAKNIDVKVDGNFLLSNKITIDKEFEIKLQLPTGFTEDKTKAFFAAAELNIVSMKGAVLSSIPNVYKDNEAKGFPSAGFKEFSVKIALKQELIKTEPGCILKIRFYDLKSKNQLRIEFPVVIAKPGEALQLSKTVNDIKTNGNVQAKSSGVKVKNINITVDTTIRVAPKMAYASLDMTGIEGSSISEVLSGKESYWVYDADMNEVKLTEKQLKQVGGAMENNMVNYLSKIPYRLKTVTNKLYTVRFRWESTDKHKIIDVVLQK